MAETTRDALLGGRLAYEQPRSGYRVGVEAPLLARFAIDGRSRPFRRALDLGAGPGAVGLCLAVTGWADGCVAIEIDRTHSELARRNAAANELGARMQVVEADVSSVRIEPSDLVIANPPWFEPGDGAIAPDATRAGARAFTRGTLDAFVRASRRLLAPRGRVVMSLPSARTVEAVEMFVAVGLHAKRLRFVHPREGEEADVVFIEAKPGKPGGLVIEPPLFIRGAGEDYTPEVDDTLRGRWPRPSR